MSVKPEFSKVTGKSKFLHAKIIGGGGGGGGDFCSTFISGSPLFSET